MKYNRNAVGIIHCCDDDNNFPLPEVTFSPGSPIQLPLLSLSPAVVLSNMVANGTMQSKLLVIFSPMVASPPWNGSY